VLDERDEFVDAATQGDPVATGEGEEPRAVGLGKVVDVAAVIDQRTGRTDIIEELADQREPPGSRQTADKDVLTRTRPLEPEAQRLKGVILPHDPGEGFYLVCRRERQPLLVAAPP
jgi:hypothetical protein